MSLPASALLLALAAPRPTQPSPSLAARALEGTIASADGVRIRYQVEGSGAPPLVFVHGWSCDRHYWDAQVPYFAKAHRVVTLDLGGHGESGLGRRDWTIPAFADDVRAVVIALDLRGVVLVGHSMGGPVTAEAARRMPDRVAALVPVDTFNNVGRRLVSREDWEKWLATLRADFSATTQNLVRKGLFIPSSDPTLVARVANAMSSVRPEVGVSALEGSRAFDEAAALEEVKVPIRCINSDRRPTDVEGARRHAPRFDAVIMKGVGHFVMMEDPATFNGLLDQALRAFAPTAPPR